MPNSTFYNLPDEKKEMIEATLLNIFCEEPISQVKVARIVEETGISRAAFYKYFIDLEDAHVYMVKKVANTIHRDILQHINENRADFFEGITQYLRYCGACDRQGSYWKGIATLIKGENAIIYRRPEIPAESPMLQDWQALLALNHFNIEGDQAALSFLCFIMDLVIDLLTSFLVNDWTTEELLADFNYKKEWLLNGIR